MAKRKAALPKKSEKSEVAALRTRIAKLLDIDEAEVELRAMRQLANSLGLVDHQPKRANPLPEGGP
jgi:hypothetical protein